MKKTVAEWYKELPAEYGDKLIERSTPEQLETVKDSLYDALCDGDMYIWPLSPEGEDYWRPIVDQVWEAKVAHAAKNN